MKALKLVGSAWVWFCVATVLGQAGLAAVLWSKGWITRGRVTQVRGALDGIEPTAPSAIASSEPAIESWTLLEQETVRLAAGDPLVKSRLATAVDVATDVRDVETRLDTDRQRFDEMRRSFDQALADMERETLDGGLQDVRQTLENMSPKQAKDYVTRMHVAGASEDLVKVFTSLTIDKRKKIVGEFRTSAEQQTLHEILRDVRLSQALEATPPSAASAAAATPAEQPPGKPPEAAP